MRSLRLLRVLTLALGSIAAGCATPGPYTWYSQLPQAEWAEPASEYKLAVGDTIAVRVYDQENLSTQGKIRSDGRMALPLVGEIVMAGKAPTKLAAEVEGRLKEFIVSPRVTVNVQESQPLTVSVLGEVANKGTLKVAPPVTVLQALAEAGGPTEFANLEEIYVVRSSPRNVRIRFTYQALINNEQNAATFPLRSGDVIVVE